MKKLLVFSLIASMILLTGCSFNINFGNKSGDNSISNNGNNSKSYIEGTYTFAIDDTLYNSPEYSEELGDAYISFSNDNSFIAYLGFANAIYGTYTFENNIITCNATDFSNEYSPNQKISASIVFKYTPAILTVVSASPSYHIKTTTMNENGDWVYDGGEKDMPLTVFSKDFNYTLYMPREYNF